MSRATRTRDRRPAAPSAAPAPAASPLARAWPWALAALFGFALAWRWAYLARLEASPLAGVLQGDERDYWWWATHLMSHGFRGTNPFFQGPLYPYVLALVRTLVGSEMTAVFRVQALCGALASVLLADAARRLTRPSLGLALGVVVALYEPLVMLDGLVLSESLLVVLESALVWTWVRGARARDPRPWVVAGALLVGAVAQGRATGVLLALPTAWIAAKAGAPPLRAALARAAAVVAIVACAALPSALWNASVAHEWIPYTYNLGYNLFVGNNPNGNGTFVSVTGGDRLAGVPDEGPDGGVDGDGREYVRKNFGVTLSPAASSRWWAARALAFAREKPALTLALAGKKALLMFNHRETPQLEHASLYRDLAGPLGLPFVGTFAFLGTLGLVGLLFAGSAGLAGAALRLHVLAITLGVLPFFATDRYRIHLVPALAVLAAIAVHEALARARAGGVAALRAPALALVAAAALVALPVRERDAREDAWRAARDLGTRWLEHGRPDRAVAEMERALALQRTLGLDRDPDTSIVSGRALLDYNYGVALHRLGRDAESLRWLRAAVDEDPLSAIYVRTLADAYLVNGRAREGDSLLARLGALVGGEGESWISRGWQAAREDRLDSAEVCFRRAVTIDSRLFGGWAALVRVQVQRGELADARASLARAEALRMPRPTLLAHTALVAAASGDAARAREALAQIPPEALAGDRLLGTVVEMAREKLGDARR